MESSTSPKRCVTTLNVQVVEEVITKSAVKSNFAEISRTSVQKSSKFTKHSVAPSEYQAAYKRFSYPRSVFNKDPVEETGEKKRGVVVKIVNKIFPKSPKVTIVNSPKVEIVTTPVAQHVVSVPKKSTTGFMEVHVEPKHIARDMEGLIQNLDKLEEISKKKKVSSLRLPNTKAQKVFLVNFRSFPTFLCV